MVQESKILELENDSFVPLKEKSHTKETPFKSTGIEILSETKSQDSGKITMLEMETDDEVITLEERKILIAKKNPLEAQILSKVISNLDYEIEIVDKISNLKNLIAQPQYDILLIDKELEEFNQNILKHQHEGMNVIMLSLNQPNDKYFNNNLIKEVHIGVIKREKINQLIKKYRK